MDVTRGPRRSSRPRPRPRPRPVAIIDVLLFLLGLATSRRASAAAVAASFCRPPSPLLRAGRFTTGAVVGASGGTYPIPRCRANSSRCTTRTHHLGIFDDACRTASRGHLHRRPSARMFAARRRAWGDFDDGGGGRRNYRDSYNADGDRLEEDRRSDGKYYRDDYLGGDYDYDYDYDDGGDWVEGNDDDEEDESVGVEWETCPNSNAQVLLPPPSTSSPPRAVLHFVGGTGYGALPLSLTYGPFLERLCLEGNFAIINTPPLSSLEELSSPLDHRRVASRARERFDEAYRTVVEDEYGVKASKAVPIVALGHSLGSRVQLILQMLDDVDFDDGDDDEDDDEVEGTTRRRRRGRDAEEENYRVEDWRDVRGRWSPGGWGKEGTRSAAVDDVRRRRRRSSRPTGRGADGTVLISFNNFEATRSVPGLYELGSWSRRALASLGKKTNGGQRRRWNGGGERDGDGRRRSRESDDNDHDHDHDDSFTATASYREDNGRRRGERGRSSRRRQQFYEDDYFEYDDWNLLLERKFDEITDAVSDRLGKFASASVDLEFRPSPRELVSAVGRGSYPRRLADRTLLVQFDRDGIDQSAPLARAMLGGSASASSATTSTAVASADGGNDDPGVERRRSSSSSTAGDSGTAGGGQGRGLGLKFARLRGDHLTPIRGVSLPDFDELDEDDDHYYDDEEDYYRRNGRGDDRTTRRGRNRGDVVPPSSAPSSSSSPSPSRRRRREEEMDDLVSSIVQYVERVVIGETTNDGGSV